MNDNEKIVLLNRFELSVLELDRAKFGRSKTAWAKWKRNRTAILTLILGRAPAPAEVESEDQYLTP